MLEVSRGDSDPKANSSNANIEQSSRSHTRLDLNERSLAISLTLEGLGVGGKLCLSKELMPVERDDRAQIVIRRTASRTWNVTSPSQEAKPQETSALQHGQKAVKIAPGSSLDLRAYETITLGGCTFYLPGYGLSDFSLSRRTADDSCRQVFENIKSQRPAALLLLDAVQALNAKQYDKSLNMFSKVLSQLGYEVENSNLLAIEPTYAGGVRAFRTLTDSRNTCLDSDVFRQPFALVPDSPGIPPASARMFELLWRESIVLTALHAVIALRRSSGLSNLSPLANKVDQGREIPEEADAVLSLHGLGVRLSRLCLTPGLSKECQTRNKARDLALKIIVSRLKT
jgi:hypothetical protein